VFGQVFGQQEADGGLDVPGGQRLPLVIVDQAGGLAGQPLEDVVDERVQHRGGLAGDVTPGVHLLQHPMDVEAVALLAPPPALPAGPGCVRPCCLARRLLEPFSGRRAFALGHDGPR